MGDGIYTYNISSEEIELLAIPTGTATNPQWSPDGQALAFIRESDGISAIWYTSTGLDWDDARQIVEGSIMPVPVLWYPG